jgi:hypothetical protein
MGKKGKINLKKFNTYRKTFLHILFINIFTVYRHKELKYRGTTNLESC